MKFIKDFFIANKEMIIIIPLIIIGIVYAIFKMVRGFIKISYDIFIKHFGSEGDILLLWFFLFVLLGFSIYAILSFINRNSKKKLNLWKIFTYYLMFSIFFLGMIFIDVNSNLDDPLKLIIRDSKNNLPVEGGFIYCNLTKNIYLAEDHVYCSINTNLNNFTSFVTFFYKNKTESEGELEQIGNQKIHFIAPKDLDQIYFRFIENTVEEEYKLYHVRNLYHFPTKEELLEIKKEFVGLFLGLLAIVLFAIPSMMINLRSLFNNSQT